MTATIQQTNRLQTKKCMVKKLFFSIAIIGIAMPFLVFADSFGIQNAAQGTDLIGSKTTVNSTQAVPQLIGTIVGTILSFVGVIFFLLILYAGILWMTAFGNDQKVDKAKDIIQHAAIGLVIVLAAYAISKFIFAALEEPAGQGTTTGQNVMGCCFNPTTNNRIQDLESQCVPNAQNPRTWTAGACPP